MLIYPHKLDRDILFDENFQQIIYWLINCYYNKYMQENDFSQIRN